MNYSRNLKKAAMGKRVIASWVIVAAVFFLVGGVSGYALKTHITPKDEEKEEIHISEQLSTTTLVYGAYDEQCFTKEISLDWGSGDLDFTPLDCKMPDEQQEFVYYLCLGYNLDFTFVMALIQHESNFDPSVISGTNDYGYMQINKMNHAELTEILGVTDYLDPEQNMRAGCYILRKLFEKYQSPSLVLMAYNMGETGAKRLWREGVYETEYTQKVFAAQKKLQKEGEKK